jgi:hypothetical protein
MRGHMLKRSENCDCDYTVPTMTIVLADNEHMERVLFDKHARTLLGLSQLTLYLTWPADLNIV